MLRWPFENMVIEKSYILTFFIKNATTAKSTLVHFSYVFYDSVPKIYLVDDIVVLFGFPEI